MKAGVVFSSSEGGFVTFDEYRRESSGLVHTLRLGGTTISSMIDVGASEPEADPKGAWWTALLSGLVPRPAVRRARPFRTVDLFCGPGGLALGVRNLCSEIGLPVRAELIVDEDEEATDVYASNHDTRLRRIASVAALVDFRLRRRGSDAAFVYEPEIVEPRLATAVRDVDLVMAGPPCQGHSNLNNQTRRDDVRNALYLTVPAFAVAARARMAIVENVPEVTSDRSRVVETARRLFESAGYSVAEGILSADAMGWPQSRRRHFLVERVDAAPIPIRDVSEALADDSARSAWWAIGDLEVRSGDDPMDRASELSDENRRRVDWLFDNDQYNLPCSERPECHRDSTSYPSVYSRMHRDAPAQTITTGFMTPGRGRYVHPTQRRALTPREAARLQGFPDTYRFVTDPQYPPTRAKLAKWIGDAVAMPLGYAAAVSSVGGDLSPFLL